MICTFQPIKTGSENSNVINLNLLIDPITVSAVAHIIPTVVAFFEFLSEQCTCVGVDNSFH